MNHKDEVILILYVAQIIISIYLKVDVVDHQFK